MEFYSMEQFEIMGDAMTEVAEWEAYEADMRPTPLGNWFSLPKEKLLKWKNGLDKSPFI